MHPELNKSQLHQILNKKRHTNHFIPFVVNYKAMNSQTASRQP